MRLLTYQAGSEARAGVMVGDHIVDLAWAGEALARQDRSTDEARPSSDLLELISSDAGLDSARRIIRWAEHLRSSDALKVTGIATPLSQATLKPPIASPGKIICLGRNYALHAAEGGFDVPAAPELFAKFTNSLIAHGEDILMPTVSEQLDYEAELAFVIGKRAKDVPKSDALDYVLGYTVMNDVSVRDFQLLTSQWLAGKTMDKTTPVGPWIVTADEIPDPQSLTVTLDVDGERLQNASTKNMIFSVAQTVAFISTVLTLEPGDIVSTGTPEGVGLARKPPRWLRSGETVSVEIERIGTLTNVVGQRVS